MPILIIAISPEIGTIPLRLFSNVTSRNDILKIIITLIESLICTFLKKNPRSIPIKIPSPMPKIIEIGTCIRLIGEKLSPCASPVKDVKSTITNTSSTEAPAIIICGILLSLPYPVSINFSIFGTITAGETAATTVPIIKASNIDMPKSGGASRTIPIISKQAGTKHIRIAGLPTF